MKTQHKLDNGTLLEVGKKYYKSYWASDSYIEILFIGQAEFFVKSVIGIEFSSSINQNWIPYTEPIEQDLKEHKFYFFEWKKGCFEPYGIMQYKPSGVESGEYFTAEELQSRGLNLSIFKK